MRPDRSARGITEGPDPREMLFERLEWRYGSARAQSIFDGEEPEANADIAKWRALGGGR